MPAIVTLCPEIRAGFGWIPFAEIVLRRQRKGKNESTRRVTERGYVGLMLMRALSHQISSSL